MQEKHKRSTFTGAIPKSRDMSGICAGYVKILCGNLKLVSQTSHHTNGDKLPLKHRRKGAQIVTKK